MALTSADLVAAAKRHIEEVDTARAVAMLDTAVILDVREPAEYAAGCLPGAANIPRGVLEFKIDSHPPLQARKDADILVYCQTGGRSALAVETLHRLGYTRAVSLAGGFKAWTDSNQPTVTPSGG